MSKNNSMWTLKTDSGYVSIDVAWGSLGADAHLIVTDRTGGVNLVKVRGTIDIARETHWDAVRGTTHPIVWVRVKNMEVDAYSEQDTTSGEHRTIKGAVEHWASKEAGKALRDINKAITEAENEDRCPDCGTRIGAHDPDLHPKETVNDMTTTTEPTPIPVGGTPSPVKPLEPKPFGKPVPDISRFSARKQLSLLKCWLGAAKNTPEAHAKYDTLIAAAQTAYDAELVQQAEAKANRKLALAAEREAARAAKQAGRAKAEAIVKAVDALPASEMLAAIGTDEVQDALNGRAPAVVNPDGTPTETTLAALTTEGAARSYSKERQLSSNPRAVAARNKRAAAKA